MSRVMTMLNKRQTGPLRGTGFDAQILASFAGFEEAYLHLLLTNTLSNVYVAGDAAPIAESARLHRIMAQDDPETMAQALIYARHETLNRLQVLFGLVYLARADRDLFYAIFNRVVWNTQDAIDFALLVGNPATPGRMDRVIKRALNGWLAEFSERAALRLANPLIANGTADALRELLRLCEPVPVNRTQAAVFAWLLDPAVWATSAQYRRLTPQLNALDRLAHLGLSYAGREEAHVIMTTAGLPYELVLGLLTPDVDTWAGLLHQLNYRDLLQHLSALQQAGVLRHEAYADFLARRLVSTAALRHAELDPVELYAAFRAFMPLHDTEEVVSEALAAAVEMSFINLPHLGGRIGITPDISASMLGLMGRGGTLRHIDVVGAITGSLLKANPEAVILPFADRVLHSRFTARDSVLYVAEKLAESTRGHATVTAPLHYLLNHGIYVDTLIAITDDAAWLADDMADGFAALWDAYRDHIAPDARAFLVSLAATQVGHDHVVPAPDSGLYLIHGWDSNVLRYAEMKVDGLAARLAAVWAVDLE